MKQILVIRRQVKRGSILYFSLKELLLSKYQTKVAGEKSTRKGYFRSSWSHEMPLEKKDQLLKIGWSSMLVLSADDEVEVAGR